MQYHRPLRLVLDTSVVVAAFRSSKGASNRLMRAALEARFTLLLSVPLMLEYESVLCRDEHLAATGLTAEEVGAVLDTFAGIGEAVRLPFHWRPTLPDANGDMVLEVAVNGQADALVTFNERDFAPATPQFGIRVMRPYETLRWVESK